MFVGVSGLIGAGKSTLTRQLADELDKRAYDRSDLLSHPMKAPAWKAVFEPVEDNPYLEDFYLDIERWTFNMQMFLLAKRFQQHQEVLWDPCHRDGGGVVQDRTIYEDTIFARMHHEDGLMVGRDWQTYIDHFHVMQGFLRYPDVILYLRVTPEKALERINERARAEEQGKVPLDYLKSLYEGYEEFVEEMKRYTVVVTVDWQEYKPVAEVADLVEEAAERESKYLRSLRRI
jgi:deoxyadenosine/deoxycytidine kinase